MLSPDDLPDSLSGTTGPLVSIILATYEPGPTINESIESVVNQTYGNIELVIVNGSDDDWLEELGTSVDWIRYVPQAGTGVANAWNEGIEAATGTYVSFLADDDYYEETKTERQVEKLSDSEVDVVYSDEYILAPDDGESIVSGLPVSNRDTHYRDYFKRGQGVPHLTVTGRTECFRTHQFDETLAAREDPHLWVRLFRDCTPAYIPEPLAYKRRRKGSLTSDPEMMYQNELQEISDLVDRFPELSALEEERRRWAKYRYGRNLLETGEHSKAQETFLELVQLEPTNVRFAALLITTLLPFDTERSVELMETAAYRFGRWQETIRSW